MIIHNVPSLSSRDMTCLRGSRTVASVAARGREMGTTWGLGRASRPEWSDLTSHVTIDCICTNVPIIISISNTYHKIYRYIPYHIIYIYIACIILYNNMYT